MVAVSSERAAARCVSYGPVCSGSRPQKLKATPPFSLPSSLAVQVLCLSSPPFPRLRDQVSEKSDSWDESNLICGEGFRF